MEEVYRPGAPIAKTKRCSSRAARSPTANYGHVPGMPRSFLWFGRTISPTRGPRREHFAFSSARENLDPRGGWPSGPYRAGMGARARIPARAWELMAVERSPQAPAAVSVPMRKNGTRSSGKCDTAGSRHRVRAWSCSFLPVPYRSADIAAAI